ncbi:MAG: GxxExxY protein, partial [Desulfosporosinus sp.]|nr:GxxExxY protein [Desulfosporosinus sp.]
MEVHRTLGPGFLEAVYQAALAIELAEKGISFQKEVSIGINYNNFGLSSIELQAICSLEPKCIYSVLICVICG